MARGGVRSGVLMSSPASRVGMAAVIISGNLTVRWADRASAALKRRLEGRCLQVL